MKTLILALTTLAISTSAFAQGDGFTCVSHWYRDAELSVNAGAITVKDSYLRGTQEVAKIIEEKMKLEDGKYSLHTIALKVNRETGVKCDTTGLLVNCQGSAANAWLAVSGWIYSNGMSGELNLTVPVELKDLRLRTSLGSNGPISIGGDKPTRIELRYLNLDARAKVVLHGQEVDLAWETFFNPRNDKNSGSFCSRY
jgi:hypothetical protein